MAQIRRHLPKLSIGQHPGGHTSVSDAVLEVIKQLAVTHSLYIRAAQVRWPWILAAADLALAAAIVRMADLALLGVNLVAGFDLRTARADIEGIFRGAKARRHGEVQEPLRNVGLERRRILASARALPQ